MFLSLFLFLARRKRKVMRTRRAIVTTMTMVMGRVLDLGHGFCRGGPHRPGFPVDNKHRSN